MFSVTQTKATEHPTVFDAHYLKNDFMGGNTLVWENWQGRGNEGKDLLLSVCVMASNNLIDRLVVSEFSPKPCWDRVRLGGRSE